jgi:hypothetical protein
MWATIPWEARGRSGSAMGPIWVPAFNLTLRRGAGFLAAYTNGIGVAGLTDGVVALYGTWRQKTLPNCAQQAR